MSNNAYHFGGVKMDICVVENGEVTGILPMETIVKIEQTEDILKNVFNYTLTVLYSETNWRLLRDANSYYDIEVPEAPVKITKVKVDPEHVHIIVIGYQYPVDLINAYNSQK